MTRKKTPKPQPKKTCKNCGQEFTPTRWWQDFCHLKGQNVCRQEYWRRTYKRDSSRLAEKVVSLEQRINELEGKKGES